jgi:hypothetical protein
MARNRRHGGSLRKFLIIAGVLLVLCLATYVKAYMDDQHVLQQYINTHTTTAPGR